MIKCLDGAVDPSKILSPVVHSIGGTNRLKKDIHQMLKKITGNHVRFPEVSSAYDRAEKANEQMQKRLRALFRERRVSNDINVVLLGRPYSVLSPAMNKGIPEIFGKQGVTAFFQDMIEPNRNNSEDFENLLNAFHWHYAAKILETAETVAGTEGLYPVLVPSFKCTPDAYTVEYFKRIMDAPHKPDLILQLDK